MFLASHIVAGLLTHEGIKDIPDRKKRAAVGLALCCASHLAMDMMPFYHDAGSPMNAIKWSVKASNAAFLGLFLVMTVDREKPWRPTEQMMWGLLACVLWDAFWQVDEKGGPHRIIEVFGGIQKWDDPTSCAYETAFILAGLVMSSATVRDRLREWLSV